MIKKISKKMQDPYLYQVYDENNSIIYSGFDLNKAMDIFYSLPKNGRSVLLENILIFYNKQR